MSSNDSPRVMGDMVTAMTLSQGVPLASNRNVQEYKELIFSSTKRIMTMIDGCVAFSHKFTFSQDVINKSVPPRYLNDLSNCVMLLFYLCKISIL